MEMMSVQQQPDWRLLSWVLGTVHRHPNLNRPSYQTTSS
jgi:hypothetical protein